MVFDPFTAGLLIAGASWLMSGSNGGGGNSNNSSNSGNWNVGHGLTGKESSEVNQMAACQTFYKGVRSKKIAEDIYYNQRFMPSTRYAIHGSWVSPNFGKAKEYGHFILQMNINAPIQYWCHYNDVVGSTSQNGLSISQYLYNEGYALVVRFYNELVILSPHQGQYFSSPVVKVTNILNMNGNSVLS